ncbi:MAG: pyridoxamine kinase [Hominenteromicrobium sp.]
MEKHIPENRRVAAIHDLSGAGKCSLTVALPVLSALGCEVSVLPTAVLSTHTGGFKSPVYRDLTEDMMPTAQHWKREGACFDALYSGFLGSAAQIGIVREIFGLFRSVNPEAKILVDPVMGDAGRLYSTYTEAMADGMTRLCEKADIIVPNMTEAYHLLGEAYREGPYDEAEIGRMLRGLCALGPETVVMTGVYFDEKQVGAACCDRAADTVHFYLSDRLPGFFHGTGDVFASSMLGALLCGLPVGDACGCAVRYTAKCIEATVQAGQTDTRWGVKFEKCLPFLMKDVFSLAK